MKTIAQAVNDPKKLLILLAVPVIIFLVIGLGMKVFGVNWLNWPHGDEIVHSHFFSTWLVDLIMIPASMWAVAVFALGLSNFVQGMHANAVREGKTTKTELDPLGIVRGIVAAVPTIIKHSKFNECTENRERGTAHMMVLFGFIGLAIVTGVFFVFLYGLQIHGPYSQLNPVKWLANVSGVALVIGSLLMIKSRLGNEDQLTTYKDWQLIGLALALGLTGMLTEMTRLGGLGGLSYIIYFIHLVFVFAMFAYTPFSKLAHLVYRTVAMGYNEWAERK
jgi:quinone-modifying oxidoreductase subunit QmoC